MSGSDLRIRDRGLRCPVKLGRHWGSQFSGGCPWGPSGPIGSPPICFAVGLAIRWSRSEPPSRPAHTVLLAPLAIELWNQRIILRCMVFSDPDLVHCGGTRNVHSLTNYGGPQGRLQDKTSTRLESVRDFEQIGRIRFWFGTLERKLCLWL